jgi:signal transduction histidine kinase
MVVDPEAAVGRTGRLGAARIAAAATAIVLAGLRLVGWLAGDAQVPVIGWWIGEMRVVAAFGIACLGAAAWLDNRGRRREAWAAALVALALAGWTAIGDRSGADLEGLTPMRPATAVALATGALSILLADTPLRGRWIAPWLGLATLVIGVLGVAGYVYGVHRAPLIPVDAATIVHTSIAIAALGVALILARPDHGWVSLITADTAGGHLIRRLLPQVAALTLALGWLRLAGERQGLYPTALGTALYAAANLVIVTALVWWGAANVHAGELAQRARAELIAVAERELRGAIEAAPVGMAIVEGDRVLFANRALANSVGTTPDALHGRVLTDLFGVESSFTGTVRVEVPDGTTRVLEVLPARDVRYGGQPARLLVLRDISDRLAMESQLVAADRLATVGTIAAGVVHELANPLLAVYLNLQVLSKRHDGISDRAVDDALIAADAMRTILADVKMLSRPEDERLAPIQLAPVIDASLRIASVHLGDRARIVRDFGEVPAVRANEARLGQVMLNLLINAAQAIPGDSGKHEVRVSLRTGDDGGAVIVVADTGVGMTPEVQRRVFEPFFTTKTGTGTGLGLSVSHRIVRALGGTIDVDSEPGTGTTMRVRLPAA